MLTTPFELLTIGDPEALTVSFCFFPIVLRSLRVTVRFAAATTFFAADFARVAVPNR